jgi:hypothetical protein
VNLDALELEKKSVLIHIPSEADRAFQELLLSLEPLNIIHCLEGLLSQQSMLFVSRSLR